MNPKKKKKAFHKGSKKLSRIESLLLLLLLRAENTNFKWGSGQLISDFITFTSFLPQFKEFTCFTLNNKQDAKKNTN